MTKKELIFLNNKIETKKNIAKNGNKLTSISKKKEKLDTPKRTKINSVSKTQQKTGLVKKLPLKEKLSNLIKINKERVNINLELLKNKEEETNKDALLHRKRLFTPKAQDIFITPEKENNYIPNKIDPINHMQTVFVLPPNDIYINQLKNLFEEFNITAEKADLNCEFFRNILSTHKLQILKYSHEFEYFMLFQNNLKEALNYFVKDKNFPAMTTREYFILFKDTVKENNQPLDSNTILTLHDYKKTNLQALSYNTKITEFKKDFKQYFKQCFNFIYHLQLNSKNA